MLSAPVKSAKRISSLFSLGSNRDSSIPSSPASPNLPKPSPDQTPHDTRPRSASRPIRAASNPHSDYADARTPVSPIPNDGFDLDEPLPPPPSLLAVNQDLANSTPNSPDGRPQSSRGRSGSRPSSSAGLFVPGAGPDSRPSTPSSKRRSWMPGRARASSVDPRANNAASPSAWIAGLEQKIMYDLEPLARGEQIPELWNESGDTYVYLFPHNTGRPASFKVHRTVFVESPSLRDLAMGTGTPTSLEQQTGALSLSSPVVGPASPPLTPQDRLAENDNDSSGSRRMAYMEDDGPDEFQEFHLYLPIPLNSDVSSSGARTSQEDTETLLLFRNLFAFLLGQSLIATPRSPSLFSIFMDVATLLSRFEFSNFDGSNFGETATTSFSNYCEELRLADVRKSREKTIEAIVLGERLRFFPLYLEGFVHGVGKLDELKQLRSPKYGLISPVTQKRLERGFIDLDTRLRVLYSKLDDFDFPSVFSGVANSATSAESKVIRFKAWKIAFMEFRRFTMQYYRQKYGSWPPKARSKKNQFEESGLNRQVVNDLYNDFANLYDMMVDRNALTTRTTDMAADMSEASDADGMMTRALRQVMSEYDRSTPPVQPPIPFDIPQYPSLQALERKPMDAKKEAKKKAKKLKDADINAVLMDSYTRESMKPTPFIEAFMQFERRCAHGKNVNDMIDLRCGQWIFLYCIIQSLPLVVVDVQDIKYVDNVEYFLCIAPRGGAPWIQNDSKAARSWFGVAGGAGVVSLPSDVVINGVEGIYRRSHCWQVAEQWAEKDAILAPPTIDDPYDNESSLSSPYQAQQSSAGSSSEQQQQLQQQQQGQGTPLMSPSGLTPPPAIPRLNSPAINRRAEHRTSIYPGLEALPLPAGVAPMDPPARPVSRFNPNMSFDDILRQVPNQQKKK
ncbi:choriogenin Hminor [Aspergillus heteromorphus CBS 117.55]|uniref:Choriogenin Hminor n=1 Tax=Aspergillus heteromorphus CBS 117.55 TaxID=1448321 RepID=A0A317UU78_9EURO|nr:choriogenin Hminor [Aspergillus heteromorphus CBS 117.55]PWY64052.1 choriogenin Hminor [Aspergillus heteromorphus CBS 117.55]